MRRAHRFLLLQALAGAAVVWMATTGDDANAKPKKKGKHGKTAASASASASASAFASASASAAPSSQPSASAFASAEPTPSAAPSETTSATPASSTATEASSGADTGASRPTGRDVMLEGVGGLIFGVVPLLGGSVGLLLLSGSGDKTAAYIGLGAATYGVFIPMTALGVAFAGHLLDVHGTYLGSFLGSFIGSAIAAAPTAVLVYDGTRGASVNGVEVVTSLYAVPMLLATIGSVIGWEVSVSKPKTTTGFRPRHLIVPGVTPNPYGATLTLSGFF